MKMNEKEVVEQMVAKEETEKMEEPVSYLFIVMFYLLGTACFVPHNFYVTANEYWMYKFRDTNQIFNQTESSKTSLQKNFTAYTGIAGNTGMVLFLFVTMLMHKKISVHKRILGSMTSLLVLFAITLIFIFVDTDSWQTGFFVIAVGVSALLSSSGSVLLVSLFQLAYRFPPRCLAAQLAGQSLCGIVGALVQVLALLATPTVEGTASLYYAIATATIAGPMIAFIIASKKSELLRSKLIKKPEEEKKTPRTGIKFNFGLMKTLLRKLGLLIASLVFCVCATGILNPGLTVLIESSGKGTNTWSDTYFIPVCVFLIFNSFEFLGRELSNHIPLLKNIYVIFGTAFLRLALLPLILLCNLQPKSNLPVVFHEDAYFIVFMILLASTSGYILNICIVVLPQNAEERSLSTLIIVLVMIVFVTLTSILGAVVVNLI
ncbi:equilibrative nucleoside transporter 3 [Anoplophora glabripennis]|uniref:equilibrative nucleoside transporter 3 n=1 Tax=Anoplophora glabripennis TaxID=217634 RepID=UPI00087476C0|nr:equilibrative nucleoside transporter 3 [Anoplophora glabripennis]